MLLIKLRKCFHRDVSRVYDVELSLLAGLSACNGPTKRRHYITDKRRASAAAAAAQQVMLLLRYLRTSS